MSSRTLFAVVALSIMLLLVGCTSLLEGSTTQVKPISQPTVAVKVATPIPSPPLPTATPRPEPNIVVNAPIAGQEIRSPVRVSGTARVFEATVQIAVKDASGKVVGKKTTTATAGAPQRGTFSADVTFTQPATSQPGTVEVYSESPKDGSVMDLVAIKVTLGGR